MNLFNTNFVSFEEPLGESLKDAEKDQLMQI